MSNVNNNNSNFAQIMHYLVRDESYLLSDFLRVERELDLGSQRYLINEAVKRNKYGILELFIRKFNFGFDRRPLVLLTTNMEIIQLITMTEFYNEEVIETLIDDIKTLNGENENEKYKQIEFLLDQVILDYSTFYYLYENSSNFPRIFKLFEKYGADNFDQE